MECWQCYMRFGAVTRLYEKSLSISDRLVELLRIEGAIGMRGKRLRDLLGVYFAKDRS